MSLLTKWTVRRPSCALAETPTPSPKLHIISNILRLPVAHDVANQVSDNGKARTSLPIVTTEQFAAWEEVSNYGGW